MKDLLNIYKSFYDQYGPQGWWPLQSCTNINKYKTGASKGYHPGDYSYPKNNQQRFEICIGAILTQNTSWVNVEKSLINLNVNNLLNPETIAEIDIEILKINIKPSGYYNQKAIYLKEFTEFYQSSGKTIPAREEVLSVKGIGPETADSILLYAFTQPEFVVDAYTKRIFSHLGFFNDKAKYNEIKYFFQDNLPEDTELFQEYHALIVEHAKNNYSGKKQNR